MALYKSISLSFISQIVNLVISFLLSIVISRMLGTTGRGDYILVITSMGFLVQVFSMGIDSSLNYYVASRKHTLKTILNSIKFFVIAALFLIVLTVFFFNGRSVSNFTLVPQTDNTFVYSILLIFLSIISLLTALVTAALNGLKKFRPVIINNILLQIISLAGVLLLYLLPDKSFINPVYVLIATALAYFITFILNLGTLLKEIKLSEEKVLMNKQQLNQFFSYSFLSFLCSVFQYLNYKSDFWIVNYYLGPSQLGIYSLAATLAQLLWIIPQSISNIMFPMSAYLSKEELTDTVAKLCRISIFFTALIIVFLIVTARFIIPLLYGEEYADAIKLFIYFLLGIIPFIVVKIFASVFSGIGKVMYNVVATLTGFVVGIIAYLVLIPRFGLMGGVVGSALSYFSTFVVVIFYYQKLYPTSYKDLLLIKKQDMLLMKGKLTALTTFKK